MVLPQYAASIKEDTAYSCMHFTRYHKGIKFNTLYPGDTYTQYSRYVVPTGRVVVPTGRYVVPAGKVIIIVSPSRLSLVPTGRILSPGSDNENDDASVHSEATIPQQQRNIQPQIITTVSNNNAKFPYLKKDEYKVWAMKMEYWITNNDMNIWKVIQNGNSLKRTGRDRDGRVIILSPTTADEHIVVQRELKAITTLLQSIPDDYVADFHYMDDARDIWNAVKARFGGNAKSKKMRKSMLKQEFSEFRISEANGMHKGYDTMQKILTLPSSWSQVALTLKTKGGLELLSFDDLYYKLKTLEVDIKGYSTFSLSQSAGPSHSAFVSTTSASKKMSYADSPSYTSSTYTVPSNSKTGSHRSGNVIEDVLQSFVADTEPEQQLAYEDFDQIEKLDLEEMDLKWQMAMLSVRVHKFEQKAGRKIDFDKKESARFNKKKVRCYKCLQRGHFARECRAKGGNDKQRYSSFKIQEIGKKEEDSKALITVDTLRYGMDRAMMELLLLKKGSLYCGDAWKNALMLSLGSLLRTGKVNIPSASPQPVPTGKPKVPEPVPTGTTKPITNLFSISQICDKKNRVLFTDTDCLVLSKDFMLPEESYTKTVKSKPDLHGGKPQEASTNPAGTQDADPYTENAKGSEELQKRASIKTVPPGSIQIPSGGTTISPGDVLVPTGGVPFPTGSPTDSLFDVEPDTRFLFQQPGK
ncbi:ribonuclease H-like domain-containing protein [Tanacetum coccineum]